jgi:cell division septation protein DedD
MKINFLSVCLSFFLIFTVISCSSSSEDTQTINQETDSCYVFDELPPDDFITIETSEQQPDEIYTVQIGAFSNFERAKDFAELSRMKLNHEIKVSMNEKTNLYVVQIHPAFNNKQDAINYCNKIRIFDEYKDVWVVTIKEGKN